MKPTNPPGRPRIDPSDTSVSVTLRVPSRQYDRMNLAAKGARLSLTDWMRQQMNASKDATKV